MACSVGSGNISSIVALVNLFAFCKQSCNQACIFAGRYMLHGTCNQSGQVQRSVTAVEFSFFVVSVIAPELEQSFKNSALNFRQALRHIFPPRPPLR